MLAFCDADDQVAPGWIAALVSALRVHAAVGGHLDEKLLAIRGQEHWRPLATPGRIPTFLDRPYLVTANMGIRRDVFEAAGGFDETLVRGEDIALSWALLTMGVRLTYVPDAVVYYRHRAGIRSMVRQHFLYGRGMSQVILRCGVPGDLRRTRTFLRANRQPVAHRSAVHYLRRASIAAGRGVGIVEERLLRRRP